MSNSTSRNDAESTTTGTLVQETNEVDNHTTLTSSCEGDGNQKKEQGSSSGSSDPKNVGAAPLEPSSSSQSNNGRGNTEIGVAAENSQSTQTGFTKVTTSDIKVVNKTAPRNRARSSSTSTARSSPSFNDTAPTGIANDSYTIPTDAREDIKAAARAYALSGASGTSVTSVTSKGEVGPVSQISKEAAARAYALSSSTATRKRSRRTQQTPITTYAGFVPSSIPPTVTTHPAAHWQPTSSSTRSIVPDTSNPSNVKPPHSVGQPLVIHPHNAGPATANNSTSGNVTVASSSIHLSSHSHFHLQLPGRRTTMNGQNVPPPSRNKLPLTINQHLNPQGGQPQSYSSSFPAKDSSARPFQDTTTTAAIATLHKRTAAKSSGKAGSSRRSKQQQPPTKYETNTAVTAMTIEPNPKKDTSSFTSIVFDESMDEYDRFVKLLGIDFTDDDTILKKLILDDDDDEFQIDPLEDDDDDDDDEEEEDDDELDDESDDNKSEANDENDNLDKPNKESINHELQKLHGSENSLFRKSNDSGENSEEDWDSHFYEELAEELGGLEDEDMEAAVVTLLHGNRKFIGNEGGNENQMTSPSTSQTTSKKVPTSPSSTEDASPKPSSTPASHGIPQFSGDHHDSLSFRATANTPAAQMKKLQVLGGDLQIAQNLVVPQPVSASPAVSAASTPHAVRCDPADITVLNMTTTTTGGTSYERPPAVTPEQYDQLHQLLEKHYQLLLQQAVLAVRAAHIQRTKKSTENPSTANRTPDTTTQNGSNNDRGALYSEFITGGETSEDLVEILDGAVGMLQDLDQNYKDSVRHYIQFHTMTSTTKRRQDFTSEGPSPKRSLLPEWSDIKDGGRHNNYSKRRKTFDRSIPVGGERRLTRAQFSKTLQEEQERWKLLGMDQPKQITVFDVQGLNRLKETFTLIDKSVEGMRLKGTNLFGNPNHSDNILELTTSEKACRHVLEYAGVIIDEDLIPGLRDASENFVDLREYFGDDFQPPCTAEQAYALRRNRNLFTSGEDNLVLRGVNLYGEKQWNLIADRFLPDRMINQISQRYSKLCYLLYKAHGISIDAHGNLATPPKLDSVDDLDEEAIGMLTKVDPPAIMNVHRWSPEEDLTLLKAVPLMGSMWAELKARLIPHRDRGHLRKRYQVLERRVKATVTRIVKHEKSLIMKFSSPNKQLPLTSSSAKSNTVSGSVKQTSSVPSSLFPSTKIIPDDTSNSDKAAVSQWQKPAKKSQQSQSLMAQSQMPLTGTSPKSLWTDEKTPPEMKNGLTSFVKSEPSTTIRRAASILTQARTAVKPQSEASARSKSPVFSIVATTGTVESVARSTDITSATTSSIPSKLSAKSSDSTIHSDSRPASSSPLHRPPAVAPPQVPGQYYSPSMPHRSPTHHYHHPYALPQPPHQTYPYHPGPYLPSPGYPPPYAYSPSYYYPPPPPSYYSDHHTTSHAHPADKKPRVQDKQLDHDEPSSSESANDAKKTVEEDDVAVASTIVTQLAKSPAKFENKNENDNSRDSFVDINFEDTSSGFTIFNGCRSNPPKAIGSVEEQATESVSFLAGVLERSSHRASASNLGTDGHHQSAPPQVDGEGTTNLSHDAFRSPRKRRLDKPDEITTPAVVGRMSLFSSPATPFGMSPGFRVSPMSKFSPGSILNSQQLYEEQGGTLDTFPGGMSLDNYHHTLPGPSDHNTHYKSSPTRGCGDTPVKTALFPDGSTLLANDLEIVSALNALSHSPAKSPYAPDTNESSKHSVKNSVDDGEASREQAKKPKSLFKQVVGDAQSKNSSNSTKKTHLPKRQKLQF